VIHLIPVLQVDSVWPQLADGMERACNKARCNWTAPELYQAVRNGTRFLHVATKDDQIVGGIVTAITETPWGRTLDVTALCGHDLRGWARDLYAYPWLREMKINRVVAEGRPGLGKLLSRLVPISVVRHVYEMDLTNAGR
jgi:hypothetical protein